MTVCAPNSRRWTSLGEALNQFDKDGLIYDVIRNYNKELGYYDRISKVIEHSELNSYADANAKNWMKQFSPKLTLDHSLPDRIGLLVVQNLYLMSLMILRLYQSECWPKKVNHLLGVVLF